MSLPPLITTVVPGLAEGAAIEKAINPWFVGGGIFVLLVVLLLGLLAFGAGRDHS